MIRILPCFFMSEFSVTFQSRVSALINKSFANHNLIASSSLVEASRTDAVQRQLPPSVIISSQLKNSRQLMSICKFRTNNIRKKRMVLDKVGHIGQGRVSKRAQACAKAGQSLGSRLEVQSMLLLLGAWSPFQRSVLVLDGDLG